MQLVLDETETARSVGRRGEGDQIEIQTLKLEAAINAEPNEANETRRITNDVLLFMARICDVTRPPSGGIRNRS